MTRVQICEIEQSLGGHPVLQGLQLSIQSGQYVVLLGGSGCGKTTTLRTIAGLLKPQSGRILFDDECVNDVPPRDRDVAMVFQNDTLYPHLTVGQSLALGLRGRIDRVEIESRVELAAGLAQVGSLLDRYPSQLSGGELRRAAVAKAIARRSSIRLLDEPLSALDAPLRHELQQDILRWHTAERGTTIHVTHDGQEAMRMADKIAVMEGGKIVQFSTPTQIFATPQTVAVAKAIGSPPMNLLSATLHGNRLRFDSSGLTIDAEFDSGPAPANDAQVIVGVRPDAFQATCDGQAVAGTLIVRGLLQRSRPMDRSEEWTVRFGDEISETIVAIVPHPSSGVGDHVSLRVDANDLHLFDRLSGRRIDASQENRESDPG